jgi:hypothetical protein
LMATGLVILLVLLTQVGGVPGATPQQATPAGEIQVTAGYADRSYQPLPCTEHDDAACCMTGQCGKIAGSPAYLPASDPDPVVSLTRYAGVVEAHDDGYAARPTLPPPRRSV